MSVSGASEIVINVSIILDAKENFLPLMVADFLLPVLGHILEIMFDNCAQNVLKFTSRNFCQQTLHVELPPGNL